MTSSLQLRPSSGEASVAGFDVREDPLGVRRHIGLVLQDPTLDDYMTTGRSARPPVIPANRFKRSMRSSASRPPSPHGVSRILLSGQHGCSWRSPGVRSQQTH